MITQETIDKVKYAEGVAYCYFVTHNSKYLKEIRRSPNFFDCWDCSGTTTTGTRFMNEFKIRNLNAKDWSGSTMIENSKLMGLQAIWRQNKNVVIKYICYFNDCCLSFNLSQRFKQGANSDILAVYNQPCKRSTLNGNQDYTKDKLVNHLCFDAEFWQDKVIRYEESEIDLLYLSGLQQL